MRPEIGAGDAGVDEDKTESGSVAGFVVDDEVEAVGEEGLHHEAHLVEGGVGGGAGLDIKSIRRNVEAAGDPAGRPGLESVEVAEAEGQFLRAGELVCEDDVSPEGLAGRHEISASGGAGVAWIDRGVDVSCIERNVAVLRALALVLPDRGDVEGGRGRGVWRLGRCGEGERRDGGEEQFEDGHRSRSC